MEFAKSHPTGHVNKCIDAMNNLIWKYNIIALDRLILCMALRTNEGMELLKFDYRISLNNFLPNFPKLVHKMGKLFQYFEIF